MEDTSISLYLLTTIYLTVYALPSIFQLIGGIQVLRKKYSLSLLKVTAISCAGLAVIAGINFLILIFRTKQAQNHDGLWIVGIGALLVMGLILILLISGIQSLILISQKRKNI